MISIQELGGPTAVARMTGLSVPTVHGWKSIPMQHCPAIERALDGRFSCDLLRPDLVWRRIADATWPHPEGRPLMDFAASTDAMERGIASTERSSDAIESVVQEVD